MTQKLSPQQQNQLDFLRTLPPRLSRIHTVIEEMAVLRADDTQVRALTRTLDEIKAGAQALGMHSLGDTCGIMATMSRRGGGQQMKVRGLRELLAGLHLNYEGALRAASTPGTGADERPR